MNDLASLNGKPRILKVGGREYRFYPLTLDDQGDLQAWADAAAPDPFAIAHEQINSGRFSVEQGKFILRTAMELATKGKPKLGTEEADALLQSPEGVQEVLYLAVRKGDPTFTRESAAQLFRQVTQNDIASIMGTTGMVEAGIVAEAPGPKANGSAPETTAPVASPSTGGASTTT